jgi:hypothetical protein
MKISLQRNNTICHLLQPPPLLYVSKGNWHIHQLWKQRLEGVTDSKDKIGGSKIKLVSVRNASCTTLPLQPSHQRSLKIWERNFAKYHMDYLLMNPKGQHLWARRVLLPNQKCSIMKTTSRTSKM